MAIVPINKITLYGIIDQKEAVLEGLQRLGCAHLINLTPGGLGKAGRAEDTPSKPTRHCNTCMRVPFSGSKRKNPEDFDFAAVEHEALEIRQRHQELSDECDLLAAAIDATKPWGEFHLPSEEQFGALRFWFYVVPHYQDGKGRRGRSEPRLASGRAR